MKSRTQTYCCGFIAGILALSLSGPAFGEQEESMDKMMEMSRQQQTQIDTQAKAIEEMKAKLDMMGKSEKMTGEGALGGPFVIKGNQKSKVVLYGHINRAILVADDGDATEFYQVDNSGSQSRFGIRGTIQASDHLTFGTLLEAGLNVNPSDTVNQNQVRNAGDTTFTRRHVDLYMAHDACGTLSMGHGSTASDDTSNLDLSGTSVAGDSSVSDFAGGLLFYNDATNSLSGVQIKDTFNSMDGLGRDVRVRYDTPMFAGLKASTSWISDGGGDLALRYEGIFADIQLLGAIAYGEPSDASAIIDSQYDGSFAMLFGGGFNIAFAAGLQDYERRGADDGTFYYMKFGYRNEMFSSGETRLSFDFGQYDDNITTVGALQYGKSDVFGIQAVHSLEALSTELYAGYRYYSLDDVIGDYEDIHALMTGLRVKF